MTSMSEIKDYLSEINVLSLYIENDSYQNILSDFYSFNDFGQHNPNDFLNTLLISLINDSIDDEPTIIISPESIERNKRRDNRSGECQSFRVKADLKKLLLNTEKSKKSLYDEIDEMHYSILEIANNNIENSTKKRSGYSSYIKKYFDELLNQYGKLSQGKRERLFFKDKYIQINECIKKGFDIIIEVSEKRFIVRPYKLLSDSAVRYLYLTGYVDDEIRSFRFSRLEVIDKQKRVKNSVDKDEKRERKQAIKERIATSGVAYLSEPAYKIEVLLTEKGYYLFSNIILFQRPRLINTGTCNPITQLSEEDIEEYKRKTGEEFKWRIICQCTKRQAEQYFLRLGSNAVVISPKDVAQSCAEATYRAALAYSIFRDEPIERKKQ